MTVPSGGTGDGSVGSASVSEPALLGAVECGTSTAGIGARVEEVAKAAHVLANVGQEGQPVATRYRPFQWLALG